MSGPEPTDFDARLAALKARFLARSAQDLVAIEAARSEPQTADRDSLRLVVHRLSGAAGTFGYAELSVAAGEADDALLLNHLDISSELDRLVKVLRETLG